MQYLIWGVGVVIFCVLAVFLIRLYVSYAVDRRISRYQNELLEKHYEEVEQMYRQTRGWRHDFKNHLQTMRAYLEMGRTDRLGNYLEELTEDYNAVDKLLRTGNIMLDAILNSKISLLESKEIRVDATASVPKDLGVSDVDLSVILGNLLDNAMEACLKVPAEKRFVRLYIDIAKDNLYIYVMNAADGMFRRGLRNYLSTKAAGEHGFGLERIDKAVKKYGGHLSRQDETDVFVTEIMLPLYASA